MSKNQENNIHFLFYFLCIFFVLNGCVGNENKEESGTGFYMVENTSAESLSVFRTVGKVPLLTQIAKAGLRPYLHPIMSPVGDKPVVLNKSDMQSRETSPNSMMPEGLLQTLEKQEVIDLVAYLRTQGE